MVSYPEVLVLGGGPAACSAARLLATWGHRVHLISKLRDAHPLAESIPPSAAKLFDLLGIRAQVDAAAFVHATGNTVWWGASEPRIERFGNGHGWQVTSAALEDLLLTSAKGAGVSIERCLVNTLDELPAAEVILDCTGRYGIAAKRHELRVYEPSHRTVALGALWQRDDPWPLPDATHTVIESYEDGWIWSVPLPDGRRHVAVMVDPQKSHLSRGGSSSAVYRDEIGKTRRFASLLNRAAMIDGPWGWDASMYCATQYAVDNVLLVGDAGSFIDPLSSAGVKKALASGWLAAVVTHTALRRPSLRNHAVAFFEAHELDVYRNFRRLTERYLADAATAHAHPFWQDHVLVEADDVLSGAALERDQRVQTALRILREAKDLRLKRAPDLRVEQRPAVSGNEIVLESRLVVAERPQGIRYLHDVDVVALIGLAPQFDQVPALFAAYCRRSAPVALPLFLSVLATAVGKGWLILRDDGG